MRVLFGLHAPLIVHGMYGCASFGRLTGRVPLSSTSRRHRPQLHTPHSQRCTPQLCGTLVQRNTSRTTCVMHYSAVCASGGVSPNMCSLQSSAPFLPPSTCCSLNGCFCNLNMLSSCSRHRYCIRPKPIVVSGRAVTRRNTSFSGREIQRIVLMQSMLLEDQPDLPKPVALSDDTIVKEVIRFEPRLKNHVRIPTT